MYSQRDGRWGWKKLGRSGLTMANWGCVVTDVAQALTLAGYNVDPGTLVDRLNGIGGFTSGGALIWGKVTQLYPQFRYGSGYFKFEQGWFGNIRHWVLVAPNGTVYEPYYGRIGYPAGFRKTGEVRYASIAGAAPAPTPQPSPGHQFNMDLSFGMRGSEVVRLQDRLKQLGFFPKTVTSTGYFGTVTRDAVSKFQRYYGITPSVGYFGPITRKKINSL